MNYLAHAAIAVSVLAASAFGMRRPSRLVVVIATTAIMVGLIVAIWAMLKEP
jgi:hypothetical protein